MSSAAVMNVAGMDVAGMSEAGMSVAGMTAMIAGQPQRRDAGDRRRKASVAAGRPALARRTRGPSKSPDVSRGECTRVLPMAGFTCK